MLDQPPGTVGGNSTATLLREAREDDKNKAVVLRVNSPGGDAFASELIRREVELTKAAQESLQRTTEAQRLMAEGQDLCTQNEFAAGIKLLVQAHRLDEHNPISRSR